MYRNLITDLNIVILFSLDQVVENILNTDRIVHISVADHNLQSINPILTIMFFNIPDHPDNHFLFDPFEPILINSIDISHTT